MDGEEAILRLRRETKNLGVRSHTMQDKQMQNQKTAIAIGPVKSDVVKDITKHLKLM